MRDMPPPPYTVAELVKLLGVNIHSVRAIDPAELPYWTTPGGHRRYSEADVLAYIEARTVRARRTVPQDVTA